MENPAAEPPSSRPPPTRGGGVRASATAKVIANIAAQWLGRLGWLLVSAHAFAAPPRHIASLDLCTDELLVMLADRSDIASLSPLAHDPAVSTVAALAGSLADNHGSAEEVLREDADLVLAEPGAATPTVNLLQRIGRHVELIDEPARLDGIADTVRHVGALLGQTARAEAAIDRMDRRLAALPRSDPAPTALFYDANGWSAGAGTLQDDVLIAAGFSNYASELRVSTAGPLALESVVAHPPDFLITQAYRSGDASLAEAWPNHPALRAAGRHIGIATSLLICATPEVADAVERLAAARMRDR